MRVLFDISQNIVFLPVLLALVGILLRKNIDPAIFFLMAFYLLVELNHSNLSVATNQRTIAILPYYMLVEMALIFWFYANSVKPLMFRLIILAVTVVIIEAAVFDSETLLFSRIVQPLAISMMCISWLWGTFSMKERKIESLPEFWVTAGILIYFLPTIFLFPIEYGFMEVKWADQLFTLQARWVVNIASKIIVSISLWKALI